MPIILALCKQNGHHTILPIKETLKTSCGLNGYLNEIPFVEKYFIGKTEEEARVKAEAFARDNDLRLA